jgi:hypothetical protein
VFFGYDAVSKCCILLLLLLQRAAMSIRLHAAFERQQLQYMLLLPGVPIGFSQK